MTSSVPDPVRGEGAGSERIREVLAKTRIGPDLRSAMASEKPPFGVIIEFNRSFPGGISTGRWTLLEAYAMAEARRHPGRPEAQRMPEEYRPALATSPSRHDDQLVGFFTEGDRVDRLKSLWTDNYVFAQLCAATIGNLAGWTYGERDGSRVPLVYKIWLDHPVSRCVYESARTIKGDAARNTFVASGRGIVWAVADTGIDSSHPHFQLLETTKLGHGLMHRDFTKDHASEEEAQAAALIDEAGHGTHVAGIIAGSTYREGDPGKGRSSAIKRIVIRTHERGGNGSTEIDVEHPGPISGIAPDCKLLSLKVLAERGAGVLSNLLAAIGYVQRLNDNGRSLKVHGLNLSLGYTFDPEWFAAGQSPLCVEVDRLVRSGVCVVVAAGNAGYGTVTTPSGHEERAGHLASIADPGNANLAITVGSTHRDMPHAYGVSYFSGKGPTADGRMKPDLVAPGERIVSCALMNDRQGNATEALFKEDSGTSMAAPHVSGAIAAFLSVRGEFKGNPERVKQILLESATDLKRRPEFQGTGLLDLMRALQSV